MVWLSVSEAALLVYTMPIWATLFSSIVQHQRPALRGVLALGLGIAGIFVLLVMPLTYLQRVLEKRWSVAR